MIKVSRAGFETNKEEMKVENDKQPSVSSKGIDEIPGVSSLGSHK